jgi:hypothetical protein
LGDAAWPDASPPDAGHSPAWVIDAVLRASSEAGTDSGIGHIDAASVPDDQIIVDGDVTEWGEQGWVRLEHFVASQGHELESEADLVAAFKLLWSPSRLYLAVVVQDDVHRNAESGYSIFEGDSVQLAFVTAGNAPYDWEYGLALTEQGKVARSWLPSDVDLSANLPFAIASHGQYTSYELVLVAERLGVQTLGQDTQLSFDVIVNEADEEAPGRTGFLELVPGIGESPKSGEQFLPVHWVL